MTTTSNNEIKIISPGIERRNSINQISFLDENKFIELSKKVENSFQKVRENYNKLEHVASPVVKDEYCFGLIKSTNVNRSLEGLLAIIQDVAKCTLDAFQANRENLNDVLNLMKVSVSIENDLYKQLENCECSKESIANLLHDFCKQYDIDSSVIEGLFEQSFNRTFTLRTRINNLREEILERISGCEERIEYFDETIRKKEENIQSKIEKHANALHEHDENFEAINERLRQQGKDIAILRENIETLKKDTLLVQKHMEESKSQLEEAVKSLTEQINERLTLEMDNIKKVNHQYKINLDNEFLKYEKDMSNRMSTINHRIDPLSHRIDILSKRTFIDTSVYKILVGLLALLSFIMSLCTLFDYNIL